MNAIETHELKKYFGDLQAVQGVTFAASQGEVLSLLGPNGAGKSTTISMLSGLIEPTAGDATIMGHSIRTDGRAAKACLGMVPQDIALYPDLSARENLVFWGKMYGLRGAGLNKRVDEVLGIIGLEERQRDRVSTFSGGMKRRVNIGAALLHKPELIIMDEPTVGIDPQSRRHILGNVKELNREGITVLYTTHYMDEAAELSDHIVIMDQGRVIAAGTHDELIRLVGERTRLELAVNVDPDTIIPAWKRIEGVSQVSRDGTQADGTARIDALVDDSNVVLPRFFEAATRLGARITSVDIKEPNLEAVFLHLTGKALRD
jgi:ABC-2 type transport system ATP-binding protein